MQSKIRNKVKFLDGETVFRKYVEFGKAGSYTMLQKYSTVAGWVHPITKRPPTKMGLWATMWRWALRNPDIARKLYAQYVLELNGDYLGDEEWFSLLEARAKQLLTPPGYRKYMLKHPEVAKYA